MKVKNDFYAEEHFINFSSLISPTHMKSSVSLLFAVLFLFLTPALTAQSDNAAKRVIEALAKRDNRHALELARTVENPDYSDKSGATLLMCCAETGASDICKILLDKGADCNKSSANGTTALYLASQNGHTDVVSLLLERGALTDLKPGNGATPLPAPDG